MEFLVNNLAYFSLNSEIHNKLTRYRKCLHVLHVNLSLYQKGVYYVSIKVFDSLPNWIADLVQKKRIFTGKLESVLMKQSFFSVNDFLEYCGMLREIECMTDTAYIVMYCYS